MNFDADDISCPFYLDESINRREKNTQIRSKSYAWKDKKKKKMSTLFVQMIVVWNMKHVFLYYRVQLFICLSVCYVCTSNRRYAD